MFGGGLCSATRKVEWIERCLSSSVTALRMTDAYGASTLRVPNAPSDLSAPSDSSATSDSSDKIAQTTEVITS